MSERATISVIMPTYNSAATVGRALQSIQAQSYPVHQVIVIDDASGDDTVDIVRAWADRLPLTVIQFR